MLDQVIDLSRTALWTLPLAGRLLRVTRLDAVIERFTDAETSITVAGETFVPLIGCAIGGVSHALGGAAPSLDIAFAASVGGAIDLGKLKNGFYDGATIEHYIVDRLNLSTLGDPRFTGTIQSIEVDVIRGTARVDCRGLSAEAESVIQTMMPMCGTDFGSVLCGKDLEAIKQTGTIGSVIDAYTVTVTGLSDTSAAFNQGTGVTDAGFRFEIADFTSGTLRLRTWEPICLTRFTAGQSVTLYPGCDKTPAMCRGYGRKKSFQGEDHYPGVDSIAGL
jgi:uncharacterized phage protein (TIGR02218 family)